MFINRIFGCFAASILWLVVSAAQAQSVSDLTQENIITLGEIPAFLAKEKLRISTPEVRIHNASPDFEKLFPHDVPAQPVGKLAVNRLRRAMNDSELNRGLGVKSISLSRAYQIMVTQGRGQRGLLSVDGMLNIAYVRDSFDNAQVVSLSFIDEGWYIDLHKAYDPRRWDGGTVIITLPRDQ